MGCRDSSISRPRNQIKRGEECSSLLLLDVCGEVRRSRDEVEEEKNEVEDEAEKKEEG